MLANGMLLQERYRIIRLLARGGMGAVYEAEAAHLGNAPVAVKQTYYNEQQLALREQFEREAATMARLRHPALPRVSDHFVEGGGSLVVVEEPPQVVGPGLAEVAPPLVTGLGLFRLEPSVDVVVDRFR